MALQMKRTILSLLQQHQNAFKALGVRRLGLFGSFVRGEQTGESDVDILVEFEPGRKTFDNFIQTVFLLEQLLGPQIDVVTPEAISPYLKPHIMREVEYVSFGNRVPAPEGRPT